MTRALKYDIPGRDWRIDPDQVLAQGWPGVFADAPGGSAPSPRPRSQRLVVEIGFGRGEFLMDQAERNPDTGFIGIELSHKRCLKMARRLARTELSNIRLLELRAERVVSELLTWKSVDCFWINFPDPWPKKRHALRRLLRADFVRDLALRLRPGGVVNVATDHPEYAGQIATVLSGDSLLSNGYAPMPYLPEVPGRLATSFEIEWRALDRDLHYFMYIRV